MAVRLGADGESSNVYELKQLGCTFISRYVSDFPSKNLTLDEARKLTAANIDIIANWENDTTDWEGGYAKGHRNALVALSQAESCGMPKGRPIYFSVDMDVIGFPAALRAYFQGACDALGASRVGVYASTAVCRELRAAGLVHWTWRVMSTGFQGGAGNLSDFNVEQTGYLSSKYDRNASITDDFGQWRIGFTPSPSPAPQPVPVSRPPGEDDFMGTTTVSANIVNQFPDLPDMRDKFPPNSQADVPNAVVWADARAAAAAEYAKQCRDLLLVMKAELEAVKAKLGA